jgi:hypothetical protein
MIGEAKDAVKRFRKRDTDILAPLRVASMGHRVVASSRLRVYALLDMLPVDVSVRAMRSLSDGLVARYTAAASSPHDTRLGRARLRALALAIHANSLIRAWVIYIWLILGTRRSEVVLLQKVLPPQFVTRWLRSRCRRLVFDFDDAINEWPRNARERVAAVIAASDAVLTTADSNVALATKWNQSVVRLLTPVDTGRLVPRDRCDDDGVSCALAGSARHRTSSVRVKSRHGQNADISADAARMG